MSKKKRLEKQRGDEDGEMDPYHFSPISAGYNPQRDGSLEKYLEKHDGFSAMPLFHGLEHFEMLKKEGWFAPGTSVIRLMWNVGRGDEHFWVTEDFKLQGIANDHHGGREGIHEPAEIFKNAPPFEAHQLWGPAREAKLNAQREQERVRYEQYQARKEIEQTVDNPQPPEESP